MCGPSSQETAISQSQQDFYNQLSQEYSTVFGQNQAITGALTQAFTPILQAGIGQFGYTPSQEQALRTQATENVGTDYASAQRATAQTLSALGGGNTFLPSSVQANILSQNANQAAAQLASAQTGITTQGYALGRQNWLSAASGLGGVAQMLNPTQYAGETTSAGSQAYQSAYQNAQQSWQPWGAALGAVGSIAGTALGGWAQGGFKMP